MTDNIPNRFIISSDEIIGEWDWNKKERCIVCSLVIDEKKGQVAKCPECGHAAHLDHFLEWLKIKGICPYCKRKISPSNLVKD